LRECRTLGGCPTGEARITSGYDLPARHVIHTVGPIWRGGTENEDETLAACYRSALALAAGKRVATLAFPAISCGVYGFPVPRACRIAVREINDFLAGSPHPARVDLACFDQTVYDEYRKILAAGV
jgi:O-acetyl-ADP-ribose deacetylase (regulator of RNase III)